MNIEQYISSGIIESYVLNLASDEEKAEFEKLCSQYPELVAERNKFELKLEQYALANSVQPPASATRQTFERINLTPVSPDEVIAFTPKKTSFVTGKMQYLAAASVIILLGIGYFIYTLQVQNSNLANTNKQLLAKVNVTDSALKSIVDARKILKDDNLSLVEMTSATGTPTSAANIYWDSTSQAVYMIVKDLPPLAPGKQYQLWALIDGKPKDLGVFDAASNRVILKMKNCKKATAFSITIETKGGNTQPSLNNVQVTGKTKTL